MSLKNIDSDMLKERWDMIIDNYLVQLGELRVLLINLNKLRKELLLIRDELKSRNIEIDDIETDTGGPPPPGENIL